MGSAWWYTILVFLFQEQASTSAVIFSIKTEQLSAWPAHLAWIILTAFDIYVAYIAGRWVQKRLHGKKSGATFDRYAREIEGYLGVRNESIILIFLGILNFPYINAFLCAWLRLDFKKVFFYLLIGNVIAYWIQWETVTWLNHFIPNTLLALGAIIVTGILISFILKTIFQKKVRRQPRK